MRSAFFAYLTIFPVERLVKQKGGCAGVMCVKNKLSFYWEFSLNFSQNFVKIAQHLVKNFLKYQHEISSKKFTSPRYNPHCSIPYFLQNEIKNQRQWNLFLHTANSSTYCFFVFIFCAWASGKSDLSRVSFLFHTVRFIKKQDSNSRVMLRMSTST